MKQKITVTIDQQNKGNVKCNWYFWHKNKLAKDHLTYLEAAAFCIFLKLLDYAEEYGIDRKECASFIIKRMEKLLK